MKNLKYPDAYMKEDSDLQQKYKDKPDIPNCKAEKPSKRSYRSNRGFYRSLYLRRMAAINPEFKKKGLTKGYQIHHIKYIRDRPDLINDFDNLVLMHPDDHKLIHEYDDPEKSADILNKALELKAAGIRPLDLF